MEGIDRYEKHHDEPNAGLYASEKVQETYTMVLEKASKLLSKEKHVILDATFQKKKYRFHL